jgi:hypothetical protein
MTNVEKAFGSLEAAMIGEIAEMLESLTSQQIEDFAMMLSLIPRDDIDPDPPAMRELHRKCIALCAVWEARNFAVPEKD